MIKTGTAKQAIDSLFIPGGDFCVYYPSAKKVYHIDSAQALEFRNMKMDDAMGYEY